MSEPPERAPAAPHSTGRAPAAPHSTGRAPAAPHSTGRAPAAPHSTGRAPAAPGAFQLLQIGAICGVTIGLGVLAGYLLDGVAGTSPLLVFVGLAVGILGAAAGAYQVIRPYLSDPPTRVADPKD